MWIFYSIRFESATRTTYSMGHTRWMAGPAGATIINITTWPDADDPTGYHYVAFVANITDQEQFDLIVEGSEEEDDAYEAFDNDNSDSSEEGTSASGSGSASVGGGSDGVGVSGRADEEVDPEVRGSLIKEVGGYGGVGGLKVD